MKGSPLIGDIVNKPDEAKALIAATDKGRKMVSDRLKDIPEDQRVRAYMANPELTTYGSGKYTGLMMAHAGALNVAASTIKGFKQVAMEQVIAWNPQVIFVQDRYPKVVDEILQSPQWQVIDAVKNHRVLSDAGLREGLGLSDAGSDGHWRAVDGEKTLSAEIPRILICARSPMTGISVFIALTIRALTDENPCRRQPACRLATANGLFSGRDDPL
ncbi:iron-chelating periplasmic-binding protein [Citrobacter koseri]|uniref:Iron-chelating periplasmic-binding protein n=1 Tax=Citrobacter koseri TaxID=545 RepID=A0A2X2WJ58_CITKO|nr:iron-chelating periplasmic-binding protein [Citrobacter koseri]